MKVLNETRFQTSALRAIVEVARQHVILTEKKIASWGPTCVQFHDATTIGVGVYHDSVTVSMPATTTAAKLVPRLIYGLECWGKLRAGTSPLPVAVGKYGSHVVDDITACALLEQAGISAGVIAYKPLPPAPTPLDLIVSELDRLDEREARWKKRIARAETALKTIARERKVLNRRADKLTAEKRAAEKSAKEK